MLDVSHQPTFVSESFNLHSNASTGDILLMGSKPTNCQDDGLIIDGEDL